MPNSNIAGRLDAALIKSAKLFREKMIRKGNSVNLPKGLDRATTIDAPKHTDKYSSIEIKISLKPEDAPWARAYEYGSGEHAEEGSKERYEIKPKEAPVLVFPWQPDFIPWTSPKFAGVQRTGEGTEGRYFFNYVEHPGVESRKYIRPTIEETKEEIRNIFAKDFKLAILYGVPKVTVIK